MRHVLAAACLATTCLVTTCLVTILGSGLAWAQAEPPAPGARPLVIPQAEGERHGKILGRALACGVPRERVDATIAAGRTRMQAAVGRALTDERYLLSLDDAMRLETSLPAPSATACEKGIAAFERLEKTAP